ncbi:class I SAM-dependent methyltransferase [Parasphingopyxis sp. CP4]|uniref:SAM-dependent methyltransferase n=1 Tax=Parasphingopyxis sp. CP4 TaxID=2724527 RepID=UPI0015A0718A|nr:cyclopropane-fatty-acyl-phospholipid synthase family protein [Parasphingopyxis sp. CP4]QLC21359.1 class I SAM-dependent methyltransferase [Parasphingopyxis sp. CP4]
MASSPSPRGQHLLRADRGFATGLGWLSRLSAPGFHKFLDRLHAGLGSGRLEAKLPDGKTRVLGDHAPGVSAEIELKSWRPLIRLMTSGSIGWYRGWAEGEWTSPAPEKLFELFVVNRKTLGNAARAKGAARIRNLLAHTKRRNDRGNARKNIEAHYDLGNDFYEAWLDETMTYSSAVFGDPLSPAEPLEEAQRRKVRMLLDRLDLKPGHRLLEIGSGWGGLMEIAAKEYGADVTGITLSTEQKAFVEQRMRNAGLENRARVELIDYRDVEGEFDAVASVEMVEAVGQEYWATYMQAISDRLKPGGKAAIQLISIEEDGFEAYASTADFIQTYVFPGGMLIEEKRFAELGKQAGLTWADRTGYNLHYAETLRQWRERYDTAVADNSLPEGFDEPFHQFWRYYLMYCEGGFRAGGIDVAQVTLIKGK